MVRMNCEGDGAESMCNMSTKEDALITLVVGCTGTSRSSSAIFD